MSKVPTLAPPACTFEFDQVSVTEALKAARMGWSSDSCHMAQALVRLVVLRGVLSPYRGQTTSYTLCQKLFSAGAVVSDACSGGAALHSQITRQICPNGVNHIFTILTDGGGCVVRILATFAVSTVFWFVLIPTLLCFSPLHSGITAVLHSGSLLWQVSSVDWTSAWPSRAGSCPTERILVPPWYSLNPFEPRKDSVHQQRRPIVPMDPKDEAPKSLLCSGCFVQLRWGGGTAKKNSSCKRCS